MSLKVPNGLCEIKHETPLIMEMIAHTSRWVHPDTFNALPIWCPETARGRPQYDKTWSRIRESNGVPKKEENIKAANALKAALGIRGPKPENWNVCHIWGYDDPKFQGKSRIVQDPHYYSCIGNMVLVPTPLKGFTDAVPDIKRCLRACAYYLYKWVYEDAEANKDAAKEAEQIRSGKFPKCYPESWPNAKRNIHPLGTAPYSECVKGAVAKRKDKLRKQLADETLEYYPRDDVREVLRFWNVDLNS